MDRHSHWLPRDYYLNRPLVGCRECDDIQDNNCTVGLTIRMSRGVTITWHPLGELGVRISLKGLPRPLLGTSWNMQYRCANLFIWGYLGYIHQLAPRAELQFNGAFTYILRPRHVLRPLVL
jgi:hypothetical protein